MVTALCARACVCVFFCTGGGVAGASKASVTRKKKKNKNAATQLFSDPGKKELEPFFGLGPFLVGQPPKTNENMVPLNN